jgi:hypothetical protein
LTVFRLLVYNANAKKKCKVQLSTASVEMLLETGLKNKPEGFKTSVRAGCSFFEQRMKIEIFFT